MRLLVTGACGFVGSTLVRAVRQARPDIEITGLDHFIREGSRSNVEPRWPPCPWSAANPRSRAADQPCITAVTGARTDVSGFWAGLISAAGSHP